MRRLAEVERDIESVKRKIEIQAEIQRAQWAITRALKTPDGDLEECSKNLDRYQKLLEELES